MLICYMQDLARLVGYQNLNGNYEFILILPAIANSFDTVLLCHFGEVIKRKAINIAFKYFNLQTFKYFNLLPINFCI